MTVVKFEIDNREPYLNGQIYGDTGPYELINGTITFAVDPNHPANSSIVDLQLAPHDEHGRVQFTSDFCLIQPVDPAQGNRRALVELPNRGRKLVPRHFNRATAPMPSTNEVLAGDGFLFKHGYTLAWIGWQWDVFRSDALMGLLAPQAEDQGEPVSGQVIVEFIPNELQQTRLLANRIHQPYPTADVNDPDAQLFVREYEDDERRLIPRDEWQFARETDGEVIASSEHVYLESGFHPGKLYDVVYTTRHAPVVGCGLLAVREIASFLRYDTDSNPASGRLDQVYGFGMSQTGRMLRHFLYLGLNVDEEGRRAYDGLIPHVAGARRGEFNHRFGQPSVQPTPNFGHRFPFTDTPQIDAFTGEQAGLLDRQKQLGHVPKIFYINTSAEYWRGDCSLIHTDPAGQHDVPNDFASRIYHFAGTQHGPGQVPQTRFNENNGTTGRYGFNTVDYTPLLRAALVNLDRWVTDGVEPPISCYPQLNDNSAIEREKVLNAFEELPDLYLPDPDRLPVLRRVDLGPAEDAGIGAYPTRELETYPAYVSAVDSDGNETAGIRLPDLIVPLGTHTGWNPRDPETGSPAQLVSMQGFTKWLAKTETERNVSGDPRPSIEHRYAGREAYLEQVRAAATVLLTDGYVLEEDIDLIVADAANRWDYLQQD